MNPFARIASALIVASIFAVPVSALADQKPADKKELDEKASKPSKHEKAIFPMKADDFRKMVEKRIERIKARVDHAMDKHNVPAPQRAEVTKGIDAALKDIHAAVDKVAADGVVTKDEAKQVKELADQLREKLRTELKEKSPRAKATKPKAKPKG